MIARVLSFEDLPKAVTELMQDVRDLKEMIRKQQPDQGDKLLNIDEVADFLHLSKTTIYSKVSRGEIPHMKKGKRLYFSQAGMMEFVKEGRVFSDGEIQAENDSFLKKKKKG